MEQDMLSGKTYQESSAIKPTPSDASWERYLDQGCLYSRQGENGSTQVWQWDQKLLSRGESWTHSISAWPNVEKESSLSQILVTEMEGLEAYCLSRRAKDGILSLRWLSELMERTLALPTSGIQARDIGDDGWVRHRYAIQQVHYICRTTGRP